MPDNGRPAWWNTLRVVLSLTSLVGCRTHILWPATEAKNPRAKNQTRFLGGNMTEILERTETNDDTTMVTGAFTTTRAELVDALATVGTAIANRPITPCMAGVLLESDGTDLLVRGYDYDTTVTVRIPDAVETAIRVLVRHYELSKLLTALTKGLGKREADLLPVTVRNEDNQCATVELADSAIPMELLPVDEYPNLPNTSQTFALVDGEKFTTETKRVLRAVGRDGDLPALTGMKIDVTGNDLTLAATDRYRLAVGHVHAARLSGTVPDSGVLIDGMALRKVLPKLRAEDIRLGYEAGDFGDLVTLESGPVTVITRLHNGGEFVKYRDHLPTDSEVTVLVDRAELLTQTQRAAAVLSAKGEKAQPVTLTVDTDTVSVTPYLGDEAPKARTRAMPATVTGNGAGMVLALDYRFFTDAVDSFTGDTLALHIQGPHKPVLLTDTPDGLRDRTEFRHLVMPKRLVN